jgi:tetratricopeptide (TPR) repeat protein/predicted aspartyl protease
MKYSVSFAGLARTGLGIRRVFALAFIVASLGTAIAAAETRTDGGDEVRRLIKQARRLTRGELLVDAEKLLRRAVDLDTKRSESKVALAFVLTKQRRLLEAYKLMLPVIDAEPKNARAFAVLGYVLLTGGRFAEARPVFFNALKLDRGEDLAWYGFGMLEFYENRIDQSILNLQEAMYHEPDEPDYQFAYAQVCARAEKYKDAADAYNRFLDISEVTDTERRARIRGLVNFLRYIGRKDGLYGSYGKDKTTVAFDLIGNRPIVKIRVNDREEPLRFVLDTGSGITVVSDVTAKQLKIKSITKGGFAKGLGGDGRFEIVYGFLKNLSIGDVSLRNVPVYIRKFQDGQNGVDGYIGLALISKFLATIDYGDNTFSLLKKESSNGLVGDPALTLPLRLTSSGFLSGQVQLEGVDALLNFIVDTGASVSVISDRVASSDGISPYINEDTLRVVGSAGITENVPTFMLPKVTFGPHSRKQVTAVALDLDIINEASGFEQAGILGGNFLKNYRMTFDFKNSKVMFTPVRPEN